MVGWWLLGGKYSRWSTDHLSTTYQPLFCGATCSIILEVCFYFFCTYCCCCCYFVFLGGGGELLRADFLKAFYFRRGLTCTLGLTNDLIDGGQPCKHSGGVTGQSNLAYKRLVTAKSFQSLVFILTQLRFGQWSLPFCLPIKFDCPAAALPENVNNHPGQFGHNI